MTSKVDEGDRRVGTTAVATGRERQIVGTLVSVKHGLDLQLHYQGRQEQPITARSRQPKDRAAR